jgi:cytochrome c oxidase subunit 4
MREEDMSEKVVSMQTYAIIFATLVVLTVVTYRVSLIDLGVLNIVVALVIAATKASLVALFFMHARWSPRLTQLVIAGSLFWLFILLALTLADYVARGPGWTRGLRFPPTP